MGGGHHGNVLQFVDGSLEKLGIQHVELIVDVVLTFHHEEGARCDMTAHVHLVQNGRHKAGQPHGAGVDVLSSKALCLGHAVALNMGALALGLLCQGADLAAGAAIPVFCKEFPAFVGDDTPQSGCPCKGESTFLCQGFVKEFFPHCFIPPFFGTSDYLDKIIPKQASNYKPFLF